MSDPAGLTRRTVLAGASAAAIVALMEFGTPVPWANALVAGYNLPYTSPEYELGVVKPRYDASDPFGNTNGPYRTPKTPHRGIDLTNTGQGSVNLRMVHPIRKGTVTFSGTLTGLGQVITVTHDDGYVSDYCHLNDRFLMNGAAVLPATRLGRVGNTGTTVPHLHLAMRNPSGTQIDPWPFISGTQTPHADQVATAPVVLPEEQDETMKLYRIVNPQGGLNGTSVLIYTGGFAVYESAYWRDRLGSRYNLALQDISQDDFTDECNRFTIPFNKVAEKAVAGGGSWSWSQQISAQIAAL